MSESTATTTPSTPASTPADVSAPAENNGAPEAAAKETANSTPEQKFKVKVNGTEREVSIDELTKNYGLQKAAHEKMQTAAQTRKEAEEIKALFEENTDQALERLAKSGKNVRDKVEKWLAAELMREMETPEQRAQREKDEKLAKYEMAEKERKEKEEAERAAKEELEVHNTLEQQFLKALESGKLPNRPVVIKQVAAIMEAAINAGDADITVDEALDIYKEDYTSDIQSLTRDLTGEQLIEFLGEDTLAKIRKADLGRLKSTPTTARPQAASTSTPSPKKSASKMSMDEFQNYLKSKRA